MTQSGVGSSSFIVLIQGYLIMDSADGWRLCKYLIIQGSHHSQCSSYPTSKPCIAIHLLLHPAQAHLLTQTLSSYVAISSTDIPLIISVERKTYRCTQSKIYRRFRMGLCRRIYKSTNRSSPRFTSLSSTTSANKSSHEHVCW